MGGRRFWTASSLGLALCLGGCGPTIGVYHDIEGGAISKARQPPPGMDQPYPNLADVPAATKVAPANEQAQITARAQTGVSAPSPGALEGLTLPTAAPPLPDVPGVNIPTAPAPVVAAAPAPAPAPAAPPPGPPVVIGFLRGSSILTPAEQKKIQIVAFEHGKATVLAGGFGEGDLSLGLSRARRLADELTASGVPGRQIRLTASAAGSGGFVQLVY
jgi:hypothetical protein